MKKQLLTLGFIFIVLLVYSCSEKESNIDYDFEYIKSIEVISPNSEDIKIDNFAKKISIQFPYGTNIEHVKVKFNLGSGVELDGDIDVNAGFNLNDDYSLKLKYKNNTIIFKISTYFSSFIYDPTSKGWAKQSSFGSLPSYISVYSTDNLLSGKKVRAYIAVVDMKDQQKPKFSVIDNGGSGYLTPTKFYEGNNKPKVVLNGGYFWNGQSLGLIIRNGTTIKQAQPMVYRTFNNESVIYYPTQGVFGLGQNGYFEANWAYSSGGLLYAYPNPAENRAGEKPMPIPFAKYPDGATIWKPIDAIGAGPILIKKGEYKNLWQSEMFDDVSGISPNDNHPRSAIGYTDTGQLILFVCEGRNKTSNTPGLSLKNVADILLDLGCVEAINLDGGGSSCMLINGNETIIPSDGAQRGVTNIIAIY